MRKPERPFGIVLIVVALPILLAASGQVLASPLISLETGEDWKAALDEQKIIPVPDPYPALEAHYGVPGNDFLYVEPELMGMDADPDYGDGLIMAWGDTTAPSAVPQVASWEYVYPEDPDLTGTLLGLTIMPPPGILSVSLTLNDAIGGWVSWAWNVPGPWNPNPAPGLIAGWPNSITIDPNILGPQAGATSFAMGMLPFNPTIATTIQADELAAGPGGWAIFPPVPVIGGVKPWNYWSSLSVSQKLEKVEIDIKPGSDPNSINPKSKGVIPVAILTTDDFDATTVDPASVRFGPDEATECHGKGHIEDVDGDDDLDMVLHFRTQETGIQPGDTEACLIGKTTDGMAIKGCDSIRTVGGPKKAPSLNPRRKLTNTWGQIKAK